VDFSTLGLMSVQGVPPGWPIGCGREEIFSGLE